MSISKTIHIYVQAKGNAILTVRVIDLRVSVKCCNIRRNATENRPITLTRIHPRTPPSIRDRRRKCQTNLTIHNIHPTINQFGPTIHTDTHI